MMPPASRAQSPNAARSLLAAALALAILAWLGSGTAGAASHDATSAIAFERGEAIWAMSADGTRQRRVGCPGGVRPDFSPDGRTIAFERNVYPGRGGYVPTIFAINAGGGRETRIAGGGAPAFSPDGGRFAFHTGAGGFFGPDIGVMSADGTAVTTFSDTDGGSSPAWSPDGQRIAFERPFSLGPEIVVMNADGTDHNRLGAGTGPAWSPDGQRIAFTSAGDIQTMSPDGTNRARLTAGAAVDTAPAFSPDGQRIALARGGPRGGDIWVMDVDGSGQTRLTGSEAREGHPAWQPAAAPIASRPCSTLSVSVFGSGGGTVIGGGGIHCHGGGFISCAASYARGTEVTLRARPAWYATFAGWGGACSGRGPCELAMDRDRRVTARFAGVPIRVHARPRQRRVGPQKRRARYRFVVRNVGEVTTGRINLCARGPQRRVRILGDRCVTRSIQPGARDRRPVRVLIRPAARGRVTRIRLIARGPLVQNRRMVARLRVR